MEYKEFERLKELTGKGPEYCREREELVSSLKAKGWKSERINLPYCGRHFVDGNGEGIFALMSPEDFDLNFIDAIPLDDSGFPKPLYVITLNYSAFYEEIGYGYVIECERRRGKRPVIAWDNDRPLMGWMSKEDIKEARIDETYSKFKNAMGYPYSVMTTGTECPQKYRDYQKYCERPDFFPERRFEESELSRFTEE